MEQILAILIPLVLLSVIFGLNNFLPRPERKYGKPLGVLRVGLISLRKFPPTGARMPAWIHMYIYPDRLIFVSYVIAIRFTVHQKDIQGFRPEKYFMFSRANAVSIKAKKWFALRVKLLDGVTFDDFYPMVKHLGKALPTDV